MLPRQNRPLSKIPLTNTPNKNLHIATQRNHLPKRLPSLEPRFLSPHPPTKTPKSHFYFPLTTKQLATPKISTQQNGIVRAYGLNTHTGLIRTVNEDRLVVVNKILKSEDPCLFLGIYDGHGGSACADYLKENLHNFIVNDSKFPSSPKKALKNGFKACE